MLSQWLAFNANVLLRSLVKTVGLYCFMISLSPRLTLLSLLEMPLVIAGEKMYNVRHQVCVAVGESPGEKKALPKVFSSQPQEQRF